MYLIANVREIKVKRVLTSFEGDFKQVYEAMKEHEVRLDACVNAAFISRSTKLRCLEADERKSKPEPYAL